MGKRKLFDGTEQTGLTNHKLGFTTNKLKVEDYEVLLDNGFTRCGTYCYVRNQMKSCCECYQYKVKLDEFKMSKSQKQTMKRFHRYLETGKVQKDTSAGKEETKNQNEDQIQTICEELAGRVTAEVLKVAP